MTAYRTTIGLEVHVQLDVRSKLFAPSPLAFGGEPNSRVSVVELGLPGVLPVLNRQALHLAIRAGLALESTIASSVQFARKNYFYPDLPKGYQISQFEDPLCRGGRVPLGDGRYGELLRIHMEEDAGKSTHTDGGSLVDLNRAGAALIEIVGLPDLHSPADAYAFLTSLKRILQFAGISECDMEKGSLRCDANVSTNRPDDSELGTKVEIKNLNSFKNVQRALEYEERRQRAVLAHGGTVQQETRLWNDEIGESATMRVKESADDYRYFPEPDLPPLAIPSDLVETIRASMPELPAARRRRFASEFGLPEYDLDVILDDRLVADYFEAVAAACGDPKAASNWVMSEVLRTLKERDVGIAGLGLQPERLAELIRSEAAEQISHSAAKKVFEHLIENDTPVDRAINALGLAQISDTATLTETIRAVMAAHPAPVEDFRNGTEKALHALLGMVMRETKGKANPQLTQRLLRDELTSN